MTVTIPLFLTCIIIIWLLGVFGIGVVSYDPSPLGIGGLFGCMFMIMWTLFMTTVYFGIRFFYG